MRRRAAACDWPTFAAAASDQNTVYRNPAFKVRGKSLAWMSPHEKGALVTRADPDEIPLLIAANPDLYFTTPHYEGHPMVLTGSSSPATTTSASASRTPTTSCQAETATASSRGSRRETICETPLPPIVTP